MAPPPRASSSGMARFIARNPPVRARPIPEPAPDTSATLPSNRMSRSSRSANRLREPLHPLERVVEALAAEIEDQLAHARLLVSANVVGDLLRRARERPALAPGERRDRRVVDRRLERDGQRRRVAPCRLRQPEELVQRG